MSDSDLSKAIDAAHRAECSIEGCSATASASRAVRAALPHIERQVREQVAREIAHLRDEEERRDLTPYSSGKFDGLDLAARITRGEQ